MQLDLIKFWNLCHLSRRKVVLSICLLLCTLIANAQLKTKSYNYLDFQKKPFYFGITFGVTNTGYKINHSPSFINNDQVYIAEGASGIGMELHMVNNLKIGEYFDFRFIPGVTFTEKTFEFIGEQRDISKTKVESVFLDAPFQIRYKSAPYKDKRAFVTVGLKYSYDVQSNSKTRQADTQIKITPHDFQAEIGAGFQIFLPFIIVSPEIKFSQGINNILIYNDKLNEAKILEKVLSRAFTFSIHLEG